MTLTYSSIRDALRAQVRRQPDAAAYTFIDYQVDPAGISETLTWSEVYLRAQVVAAELSSHGARPGDRVAIVAPQGLDYIVGFLGTLEAGLVAVPLPVPHLGAHDERVTATLKDSGPVAILTRSDAVNEVVNCAHALPGSSAAVIEIDALAFDAVETSSASASGDGSQTKAALLQYTSGSTRRPAGVVVTHKNIIANLGQVIADYFEDIGGYPPADMTLVSWLPFYHDMGLLVGITGAVVLGLHAVVMDPVAFLQKPARWIQLLAANSRPFTAAPNFGYELAARRTSDEDMAGLDLGHVIVTLSGSERIHAATLRRFLDRFSRWNFPPTAMRPSYGLAEAMVYAGSSPPSGPPVTARFDYEKLSAGYATFSDSGPEMVSLGPPRACTVRIVDPETCIENPAGKVGEVWLSGDNIAAGYWRNPQLSEQVFGGRLVDPSPGTPRGPWLRTGDLGVIANEDLYIIGRIKDMLIVDGRNHYPDDIEATIQEITGGRVAAVGVADDRGEQLVAIIELKMRAGSSDEEMLERTRALKKEVLWAVSRSHGLRIADLVVVAPGSLPITTSGKIRRSACADFYRQQKFVRLDSAA